MVLTSELDEYSKVDARAAVCPWRANDNSSTPVRVRYNRTYYCPSREALICKGCGITMNLAYPLRDALEYYGEE